MMNNNPFWTILIVLFSCNLYSQVAAETDSDKIYLQALKAYKNSDFEEALSLSRKGLEIAPEYHDIRILKIRSLWVLEKLKEADEELNYLLINASEYPDVNPLIHQRINKFPSVEEQLQFLTKMEIFFPEDLVLQTRKAEFLVKTNRREEGRKLAQNLLSKVEISGAERYSLQLILARTSSDEIGINYQVINFSDGYTGRRSWHTIAGEYLHNFRRTSFIGRVNYTDRGYEQGMLFEIEAYPVFNERFYAFTNLGVSNGKLFPDVRSSLSLYYNFLKILEAEAGGRLQNFRENSYFTGVVGMSMYQGNFFFNIRSFIGPKRLGQVDQNYQGNIRYYFTNVDNYLFLRIGSGISPDERILSTRELTNPKLETSYGLVGINFSIEVHHLFQVSTGILKEEIINSSEGVQFLGNMSYRYRF